MRIRRALLSAVAVIFALAAIPATSAAKNLYTLDGDPVSAGHVIEDAAGNAYIAWTGAGVGIGPDVPKFCKVAPGGPCSPITLPIPGGETLSDSPAAAIPVFGPGNTVYVVGPRYARNDVIFWTSNDGGLSFDGGVERDFYSSKTTPTDAFLLGGTFLIGAYNSGIGVSTAETAGLGGGEFSFTNPGTGGVASASMGLDGANPVIAYWNISEPPYPLLFYRYTGGSLTSEASWQGPVQVTNGYEPSLAGGAAGLFMVSQDYSGGSQYPNAVNVRRFEGTGFGAPKRLALDSSTNLFAGGAIAQSPSGNRIAVAWPGEQSGSGAYVMRLFTSTNSGGSYVESHVARIGDGYGIGTNAEVATNDGGTGWLVFTDSNGLRLADLTPIAGSPGGKGGIYKGKTKVVATKAGSFLILLRLPKSCLKQRQRFFVGVGKRKRGQLAKRLGGTIRFTKVVFIYDGKRLKVKKKKPFRYLVNPGSPPSGSVHVVKARVTAILTKGNKEKKIKRVIKGKVRAC